VGGRSWLWGKRITGEEEKYTRRKKIEEGRRR
jgi:hypothetical protein